METIITSIALVVAVAVALSLGAYLPMVLPRISPLWNRKPFNCRPCATFHLLWVLWAGVAYWKHSVGLLGMGFVFAFVLFGILHKRDRKKIID